MENVRKVFVTDEVETHALAGINLEIQKGEYIAIAGPSGCGKSTCWQFWDCWIRRRMAAYVLNGHPAGSLSRRRTGARSQSRNRIHLPGIQSHRRSHGVRECGTSADLPRDAVFGASRARAGGAGKSRDGASHAALSFTTVGRPATTRRRRARPRRQSIYSY